MLATTKDVHPQTVPVLYDSLKKLGYDETAVALLKDSKQTEKALTKTLDPNISMLNWIKSQPKLKTQGNIDLTGSETSDTNAHNKTTETSINDKFSPKKRNLTEMQKEEVKNKKMIVLDLMKILLIKKK